MRSHLIAAALMLSLFTSAAAATELDRLLQLDHARQDERAAFEHEFTEIKRLEPERIRAEGGRVERRGGELALRLGNGGRTFFRDDESQCLEGIIPSRQDGCASFFFIGHPAHFYLLRARYDAGSDYRLVDDRTGVPTRIPAEPHFSPQGTRFVTVSATDAYDPAGLEIWSLAGDTPKPEWKHDPAQYAIYYFVRWLGEDEIALEVKTYVGHELRRVPARLMLGPAGWRLEGPAEASRY